MKGGVMSSQQVRAMSGYMPPALPFAQLPNPDSVIGQVYIASDVGPAPGIELIAAPGRWRPRGGRQVLAMRMTNPITIQDLNAAGTVMERIGPFPGGLVRAGMQIEIKSRIATPAVNAGGAGRDWKLWAGPSMATTSAGQFLFFRDLDAGTSNNAEMQGRIDVLSDTSINHIASPSSVSTLSLQAFGVKSLGSGLNPLIDFSAPWEITVLGRSLAETAVNISSATWAVGIATFNTSAAHTLAVGDKTVTAGVTPSGYNGTFIVASVPTTTQFTVTMAADPGAYSTGGTSSRISNVISRSYVLELIG